MPAQISKTMPSSFPAITSCLLADLRDQFVLVHLSIVHAFSAQAVISLLLAVAFVLLSFMRGSLRSRCRTA